MRFSVFGTFRCLSCILLLSVVAVAADAKKVKVCYFPDKQTDDVWAKEYQVSPGGTAHDPHGSKLKLKAGDCKDLTTEKLQAFYSRELRIQYNDSFSDTYSHSKWKSHSGKTHMGTDVNKIYASDVSGALKGYNSTQWGWKTSWDAFEKWVKQKVEAPFVQVSAYNYIVYPEQKIYVVPYELKTDGQYHKQGNALSVSAGKSSSPMGKSEWGVGTYVAWSDTDSFPGSYSATDWSSMANHAYAGPGIARLYITDTLSNDRSVQMYTTLSAAEKVLEDAWDSLIDEVEADVCEALGQAIGAGFQDAEKIADALQPVQALVNELTSQIESYLPGASALENLVDEPVSKAEQQYTNSIAVIEDVQKTFTNKSKEAKILQFFASGTTGKAGDDQLEDLGLKPENLAKDTSVSYGISVSIPWDDFELGISMSYETTFTGDGDMGLEVDVARPKEPEASVGKGVSVSVSTAGGDSGSAPQGYVEVSGTVDKSPEVSMRFGYDSQSSALAALTEVGIADLLGSDEGSEEEIAVGLSLELCGS
jgi:hypothetical protein